MQAQLFPADRRDLSRFHAEWFFNCQDGVIGINGESIFRPQVGVLGVHLANMSKILLGLQISKPICAVNRRPGFRLLATMNSATDAGKADLAPTIRNRFWKLLPLYRSASSGFVKFLTTGFVSSCYPGFTARRASGGTAPTPCSKTAGGSAT